MKPEPRKQFTFYKSHYDAIHRLSKKDQSAIILAVCAYALYEAEPSGLSGTAAACFALIRPTLDSGRRKAENGKRSGRKSSLHANREQSCSEYNKEFELDTEYECIQPPTDDDSVVEQIVALQHNLCPDLPACQLVSPSTRRAICARWSEHPSWEIFSQIFSVAQQSRLLTGKQVNWHASLDRLMERDHFARVYDGCYDNTALKVGPVPLGGSGVLGEAKLEAIRRVLNESDHEVK